MSEEMSPKSRNFAFELYKILDTEENVCFSPLSLEIALAMIAVGAKGSTLAQLEETLMLPGSSSKHKMNQEFEHLLISLSSNSNNILKISNRIYVQDYFQIKKNYVKALNEYYQADAINVNFLKVVNRVTSEINQWINDRTDGNIKHLLLPGDINDFAVFLLLNTIYFKGKWQEPFDPQKTFEGKFTLKDGKNIPVAMMKKEDYFKYAKSNELKSEILQLDYAGSDVVMFIILPNEPQHFQHMQKHLTPHTFNSSVNSMENHKVHVQIPKFVVNFRKNLNENLVNLGITDLFEERKANLSGICELKGLYVSLVLHQTYLKVEEEGTTAAAASAMEGTFRSMHFNFIANHPFVFIIYHTATNQILFMGDLKNPIR